MNDSVTHIAQANLAIAKYPLDDLRMAGFVEQLDAVNALAEASPGFVWRLDEDGSDALAARLFAEPRGLFNLTVWRDIETLKRYVYGGQHAAALRERGRWFEQPTRAGFVLWRVARGHRPGVREARERFECLWSKGPTPAAFTFRQAF